MSDQWETWSGLPWLQQAGGIGTTVQLCDRLLNGVAQSPTTAEYLTAQLPDVASEFSLQWVAIVDRWPEWRVLAEFGRSQLPDLPVRFFEEAFDRDAAGLRSVAEPSGWSVAAVPLENEAGRQVLLAFAGRRINDANLRHFAVVGRTLSYALDASRLLQRWTRQTDRLKQTLRVAYRLSDIYETVPLLEALAEEATKLLECDRASIFIWDRANKKLLACPALGVEGGTLSLPDDVGIVGTVIQAG